jgi:hypothetical protein
MEEIAGSVPREFINTCCLVEHLYKVTRGLADVAGLDRVLPLGYPRDWRQTE